MDTVLINKDDGGRQERGLLLSQSKRIKKVSADTYYVPSQFSNGGYIVTPATRTCSCPDHELRGATVTCKHIWAVEYVRNHVVAPDGSTITTHTMRVTYRQNWPKYNAYQVDEKDQVRVLLRALCEGIQNPVKRGRGRPRLPLADVVYAACMKTFVGLSGRRSSTDIADCLDKNLIDEMPAYNTVFEYVERPELTPLLQTLIQESAAPIADIDLERAYGVDGTGFSTTTYKRWFDAKYGKEMKEAEWKKLHIAIGVRSKIVTAAVATEGSLNDSPFLPQLMEATAKKFTVNEVLADKGYLGMPNFEAIEKLGASGYIPFKSNNVGEGPELWRRAFHLFAFHRQEFLEHYNMRSNVESVFSSIKRKFGPALRAKKHDAQVNECLLKVICHNLSVLVRSIHELGIEPMFWKEGPAAVSEVLQ